MGFGFGEGQLGFAAWCVEFLGSVCCTGLGLGVGGRFGGLDGQILGLGGLGRAGFGLGLGLG